MGRVGCSLGDISGGVTAYAASREALLRRGRTGEGAAVKV